jgi:probable F420-dependent oxidoreductase
MRVGVSTALTDGSVSPTELAIEVEARDFDTLTLPEHTHVPVSRTTSYPQAYGGGSIPDAYRRMYDPFVALSFAAAATTRLRIGTGVCLLALRDAIETSKQVATLDVLSGGRFFLGIGFGWNEDEFENHGVPFRGRHELVREKVELMKRLWTDDVASYAGEHVHLTPSWCWPKPSQKPHPPIYLGGNGPLTMRHAARWADTWYPTGIADDPDLDRAAPLFRQLVEDAGRQPSDVGIGIAPAAVDARELEAYARNGIDECNVWVVAENRDDLLRNLDALKIVRETALSGSPQ